MFALALLSFVLGLSFTSAQDANCDFVQNVQAGIVYNLSSPNYPYSYPRGVTCRWCAVCSTGYNCRLDCPVVQLPQSPSCGDRIMVSRVGDPQLNGASVVCESKPFTVVSTQQRLCLALVTSTTSTGGGFSCQLYAQPAATPTPTCDCGKRKQVATLFAAAAVIITGSALGVTRLVVTPDPHEKEFTYARSSACFSNRIVGGDETGVNEFPMLVGVISVTYAQIKCGGAIISNRHAASAAHCTVGETINTIAVLVGDHNINTNDTSTARGYRVQSIQNHPQYNPANYNYDVSIITTTTQIAFNENVSPVCMPFKFANTDFTGRKLIIVGWGTISPGGPTSPVPRKVEVDVISESTCRTYVSSVTSAQICTYTPGKDACQYDSGGPCMYTDPSTGRLFLMALVSFGRFCGSGEPAVNTRVTAVQDWIVSVTGVDFCRV